MSVSGGIIVIVLLLNILLHFKYVATLPREMSVS